MANHTLARFPHRAVGRSATGTVHPVHLPPAAAFGSARRRRARCLQARIAS